MTTMMFLKELQALGVRLTANGDKLGVNAPRGVLTDAIRARLVEHKAALLALLSSDHGCADTEQTQHEEVGMAFHPGEPPEPYKRFLEARLRLVAPAGIPLRVMTPKGKGNLWQVGQTRIGVVLDGDTPKRVTFFTQPDELEAIQPLAEVLTDIPEYMQ
jgi:hypothetical protein